VSKPGNQRRITIHEILDESIEYISENEAAVNKEHSYDIKAPKDPQEEEVKKSHVVNANETTTQSGSPSYVVPEAPLQRRRDLKAKNKQHQESLYNRDNQFKMPEKHGVVSEKEVQESLIHFLEVKNGS
jgi:hypothetical protein